MSAKPISQREARALNLAPPTTAAERTLADAERMLDRAKMRCYTTRDRDRIYIPGCIGGAVYGRSHCTCARTTQAEREWRDIVARLVSALRKVTT
jgi:hypothetical protein